MPRSTTYAKPRRHERRVVCSRVAAPVARMGSRLPPRALRHRWMRPRVRIASSARPVPSPSRMELPAPETRSFACRFGRLEASSEQSFGPISTICASERFRAVLRPSASLCLMRIPIEGGKRLWGHSRASFSGWSISDFARIRLGLPSGRIRASSFEDRVDLRIGLPILDGSPDSRRSFEGEPTRRATRSVVSSDARRSFGDPRFDFYYPIRVDEPSASAAGVSYPLVRDSGLAQPSRVASTHLAHPTRIRVRARDEP